MKVLISSIGSRGDVQPIVALALELRALGHAVCLCVAPNFKEWVESFGLVHVPIGPDLKKLTGGTAPAKRVKPSKAQLHQLAVQMIRGQFQVLTDAARGCDLIVAAGALQIATRSIAEALKIPYVFAAYCPVTFPSPDHPPPKIGSHYSQTLLGMVNRFLWMRDARSWDALFLATLNEERLKVGLGWQTPGRSPKLIRSVLLGEQGEKTRRRSVRSHPRTFEPQLHNLRVTRMPGARDGTPCTRAGVPC
jgi:vancomycin aglycone glucosyltransferase